MSKVIPFVNSFTCKSSYGHKFDVLFAHIISSVSFSTSPVPFLFHRMTKDEYEEVVRESLRFVKEQLYPCTNIYAYMFSSFK